VHVPGRFTEACGAPAELRTMDDVWVFRARLRRCSCERRSLAHLAWLRLPQVEALLTSACGRQPRGSGQAEHREPSAACVDQSGPLEGDQCLSGNRRSHPGSACELGRVDVARVSRQAEQGEQDTICSGLVHGDSMPLGLKPCPVSDVQLRY
jgi:hypothetical protein